MGAYQMVQVSDLRVFIQLTFDQQCQSAQMLKQDCWNMSPLEALENANENHVKSQLINAYKKPPDNQLNTFLGSQP